MKVRVEKLVPPPPTAGVRIGEASMPGPSDVVVKEKGGMSWTGYTVNSSGYAALRSFLEREQTMRADFVLGQPASTHIPAMGTAIARHILGARVMTKAAGGGIDACLMFKPAQAGGGRRRPTTEARCI